MKKLLIISRQQFGYLVDIYKWCEYLSDEYQIEVITFGGKEKIILDKSNVKVRYVSYKGNKILRGIRFVCVSLWYILFFRGNIIVEYFSGCSIFKKLLPWKKMILDIRTLSVNQEDKTRIAENNKIKQTCDIYDIITIISEGTRDYISLEKGKSAIIPLGSDIISNTVKNFDTIRLLYIGTLSGRDIDKTLNGLSIFIKAHSEVPIHYDIIGDGYYNELNKLMKLIRELSISENVTLHGFMPHSKIKQYLDKCNIGVSFVPITDYYNYQPPTKSYEYILSGLYTIATDTFCNRNIINNKNGILIKDNEIEFANAINYIYNNSKQFNSSIIRETLSDSTWENIVKNNLLPCLSDK